MKILVATDDSQESRLAVKRLASRPWPKRSTVRVLSVSPSAYWATSAAGMGSAALEKMEAQAEAEAQRAASAAAESLKAADLAVETKVRRGDPRTEIVDEASEWSSDLIVLGSRGKAGLGRWLMGSVAAYVVRHAPCSVEVARDRTLRAEK